MQNFALSSFDSIQAAFAETYDRKVVKNSEVCVCG